MDFSTLLYTGLLALAIFSVDAWQHGDQISLSLTMPKGLGASETSLGDAVAETIFLNEVADLVSVPTIVQKPRVRSTNDPSVTSMIGEMLGLKQLTRIVQRASGLEPLELNGSLIKVKDRYQLILVANNETDRGDHAPFVAESVPGETVPQLIQRAAPQAILPFEDYLVCLYLLYQADQGRLPVRPQAQRLAVLLRGACQHRVG